MLLTRVLYYTYIHISLILIVNSMYHVQTDGYPLKGSRFAGVGLCGPHHRCCFHLRRKYYMSFHGSCLLSSLTEGNGHNHASVGRWQAEPDSGRQTITITQADTSYCLATQYNIIILYNFSSIAYLCWIACLNASCKGTNVEYLGHSIPCGDVIQTMCSPL